MSLRNFTVLRVWGIPIRINVSLVVFLPILAYLIGSGQQIEVYAGLIGGIAPAPLDVEALRAGSTPWVIGVAAAVGLFVSVTLHELGHAWAAMRYGIEIESITLWILGGLAALKRIPREWNREFWIAIAGPATSLVVGVACWGLLQTLPGSLPVVVFVVGWLAVANVVLTVFNLVPAFPMDGGRILRAILARSMSYGNATRVAAAVGVAFALLFALVGIVAFDPVLLLLAVFIYMAATGESRAVALEDALDGITIRDVMRGNPPTVAESDTIEAFVDRMLRDRHTSYPVVDGTGAIVGVVSLADIKRADRKNPDARTVADIVRRDIPRMNVDARAFDMLTAVRSGGSDSVLVESNGDVVGVVSAAEIGQALRLRELGRPAESEGVPVEW